MPKSSISLLCKHILLLALRAVYVNHKGNIDIIEIIHQYPYCFNFFNSRPISRFFFCIFVDYFSVTRIKAFQQIKHFISRDYKTIINEELLKYLSNVFSENKYVLVQISASTGRGDFNNSTNVTHTQIQLMMMI